MCAGIDQLTVGAPEDNADITAVISAKSADFIEARPYLMYSPLFSFLIEQFEFLRGRIT